MDMDEFDFENIQSLRTLMPDYEILSLAYDALSFIVNRNNKIGNITAPHTKWVAQYYKECQYQGAYDMWQYSSSESVPGIASKTDVNWCYKKF